MSDYRTRTSCYGNGVIICRCGGDICICGTNEMLCPGCAECEGERDDADDLWDERDELAEYEFWQRARRDSGED